MRVMLIGLALALGGCWGLVESDGEPEVGGDDGGSTEALTDCPEFRDQASCDARGPGWVGPEPVCDDFGGYLGTGCHWVDSACVRGPYSWARRKCGACWTDELGNEWNCE
jgi:hypothetical protein